ncbi:MAG TPA: site-specific DNA-methyltransferase [Acidimicrobiales bacterium]|nr:site-specific DNA-methyltransferase [Acidimicrobiales bacterium]
MSGRRKPTSTSSFGVGRRESHDASGFYARFNAPVLSSDDAVGRSPIEGKIVEGDARNMGEVEDASVALVVTSPPYFAGKEYEEALGEGHVPGSYLDYLQMLTDVFAECVRTLEPGGRIAVNVANLGRKPYRSLSADVIGILQDQLGLLLRGEVVWVKARGANGSCAWGSFRSPANPVLRDVSERVVIASKGRFDRAMSAKKRQSMGLAHGISTTKDEFVEATTDVWEMAAESATRVGHPAPFPLQLPLRLIELYTYVDDLVLDPFMGSGTTAVAAVRSGRRYVGYDTESGYVRLAEQRAEEERSRSLRAPVGPRPVPGDGAAKAAARALVEAAGFSHVVERVRLDGGVELSMSAADAGGRRWFFDVVGSFSTTSGGLRRADSLWKVLGKAAVVHATRPENPLVLLTTEAPLPGSTGDRAWRALQTPEQPGALGAVHDVIEIESAEAPARLRRFARSGRPARGGRAR